MQVRARDQQLVPPERTSGWSALAWLPAGRAPPSRREPYLTRPTLRGSRRSDRLRLANSSTDLTAPTRTPCRGTGRGRGRRTGVDVERVAAPSVIAYSGRRSPKCTHFPRRRQGPRINPGRGGGRRIGPGQPGECSAAVEVAGRSGAAPELVGSKRAALEQGLSGRPVKKSRVRSKM
jgi:hypothetical protein